MIKYPFNKATKTKRLIVINVFNKNAQINESTSQRERWGEKKILNIYGIKKSENKIKRVMRNKTKFEP